MKYNRNQLELWDEPFARIEVEGEPTDMNVVRMSTKLNRRVAMFPVTGNTLERNAAGQYQWTEPNEQWRTFSHTGGSRCIITNLRADDSEHSPDLWLYSNLTKDEIQRDMGIGGGEKGAVARELIEDNTHQLDRCRRWYVRQFIPNTEKIGIRRFTSVPLKAFFDLWRTPVLMSEVEIFGLNNGQMKFIYGKHEFNAYVSWPELQEDMKNTKERKRDLRRQDWKQSEIVIPWLKKNIEGEVIFFSDYDRMFTDTEDEFSYMADLAG